MSSQEVDDVIVECTYGITEYNEYECLLEGVLVTDPTANVTFSGVHLENKTEADVLVVFIRNSNTPFMIPQLFTTFPNMVDLEIESSNLQSIDVPASVRLQYLILYRNTIMRLESGSIQDQTDLYLFEATGNYIHEIDEDFFEGMPNTFFVDLSSNHIQALAPSTFTPLRNVVVLDFYQNALTSLGDELFISNSILLLIYFGRNQISEVHHDFVRNLPSSLQGFEMTQNLCVDRSFSLTSPDDLMIINNALNQCFRNFNRISGDRNIAMQVQSGMTFQDEFGNNIFRT